MRDVFGRLIVGYIQKKSDLAGQTCVPNEMNVTESRGRSGEKRGD